VPVNQLELSRSADGLYYRSQLINPANVQDVVPANNQKASTVSKPR
jgi:hypothetical protein